MGSKLWTKLFADTAMALVRRARRVGTSSDVYLVLNVLRNALLFKIVVELGLCDVDGDGV